MEHGYRGAESLDDASIHLVADRDSDNVQEAPQNEVHQLQVLQNLGYDVNAINRSGRDINDQPFDSHPEVAPSANFSRGSPRERMHRPLHENNREGADRFHIDGGVDLSRPESRGVPPSLARRPAVVNRSLYPALRPSAQNLRSFSGRDVLQTHK